MLHKEQDRKCKYCFRFNNRNLVRHPKQQGNHGSFVAFIDMLNILLNARTFRILSLKQILRGLLVMCEYIIKALTNIIVPIYTVIGF